MIEQDKLEDLTKNINRYVKTNLDLIKYQAAERSCVIGSKLIANLILFVPIILLIVIFRIMMVDYKPNNKEIKYV